MALNERQIEAARYVGGPSLIVAGPGTGKTSTLTDKYANLLRAGERPDRIMCLTFSAEAAKEMRRRIAAKTGLLEASLRESVLTFHSLGFRIIMRERALLGFDLADNPVLPIGEDRKILREIVRRELVSTAKSFISRMRRSLLTPRESFEQAEGPLNLQLAQVYQQYDEALREEGCLDFDAMLFYAVQILVKNEAARERWQDRAKHLIVDEAHDNSHDQVQLARLLTAKSGNLTQIFDLSQSIYSFRGADPSLLLEDARDAKKFYLTANYRSGSRIIDAFRPFAEPDELSRRLMNETYSGNGADGVFSVEGFGDEYAQAKAVCDEIANSGMSYADAAVIARTKAVLFPYCEVFEERGIPYFWRGKNLWHSPEIQDAVAFVRLAVDPTDKEAFVRCCTSQIGAARYIGRKLAEAIARRAGRGSVLEVGSVDGFSDTKINTWRDAVDELNWMRALRNRPAVDFLREIQSLRTGVYESQSQEPDDFSNENLGALVRRSERFGSLAEFVIHARKMSRRLTATRGVTLSTVHGSKGLEWENVFVVGVKDKIFPHERAEDPGEERRIMYVALSRAKSRLWVSWHEAKSMFVDLLPPVEQVQAGLATA